MPLVKPRPVVAPVVLSVICRSLTGGAPVAVAVILPPTRPNVVPGIAACRAASTPPTVVVAVRSILVPDVPPLLVKLIVTGAPAPTVTVMLSVGAVAIFVDGSPASALAPVAVAEVSLAIVMKSCGFMISAPSTLDSWYCPFLGSCGKLSW